MPSGRGEGRASYLYEIFIFEFNSKKKCNAFLHTDSAICLELVCCAKQQQTRNKFNLFIFTHYTHRSSVFIYFLEPEFILWAIFTSAKYKHWDLESVKSIGGKSSILKPGLPQFLTSLQIVPQTQFFHSARTTLGQWAMRWRAMGQKVTYGMESYWTENYETEEYETESIVTKSYGSNRYGTKILVWDGEQCKG